MTFMVMAIAIAVFHRLQPDGFRLRKAQLLIRGKSHVFNTDTLISVLSINLPRPHIAEKQVGVIHAHLAVVAVDNTRAANRRTPADKNIKSRYCPFPFEKLLFGAPVHIATHKSSYLSTRRHINLPAFYTGY